jgi:hypothetical protein
LSPALPEARPALALHHRHGLPQPGAKQEQADNGRALPGPERIAVKVFFQPTEMVEVKAEMKDRHPDNGHSTQGVNGVKALGGHAGKCRTPARL